jgi:hypothetical protein
MIPEERSDSIEQGLPPEGDIIQLREISDADAQREIAAHFKAHSGETLFYSDLADALDLPLEPVVAVCERLINEGVIGIGENS